MAGVYSRVCEPSSRERTRVPRALKMKPPMSSEVKAISPRVERLIRLIEESQCAVGEELASAPALREALSNEVVYCNRLDPGKLVQIIADVSWAKGCPSKARTRGGDLAQTRFPTLRLPRISRPSMSEVSG